MISRKVFISGGSRGIGKATAELFAERNGRVAFSYEHNAEAAKAVEAKLQGSCAFAMDLRSEASVSAAIAAAAEKFGGIDTLIVNAGIWEEGPIEQLALEDFERTMQINMTGTFLLVKHALAYLKRSPTASIVIISSTAGQRGESRHAHYAASKGAQISFVKSIAIEFAPMNIRVNCVAPGWVATDMTAAVFADPTESKKVTDVIPLGRPAEPREIAEAIYFLATEPASFITGEILNVNGGAVLCG